MSGNIKLRPEEKDAFEEMDKILNKLRASERIGLLMVNIIEILTQLKNNPLNNIENIKKTLIEAINAI